MRRAIALWALASLVILPAHGGAQTTGKYYGEAYGFFGRRTSTPGTDVGGGGFDVFLYKGLGWAAM